MKSIAIIGGGLSGTLLTINLLKNHKSKEKLKITLIEKEPDKFNLGVAYSTTEFSHLLNVRAGSMSIFKDEAGHLVDWLKRNGYNYQSDDFIPRQVYGFYLKYYYKKWVSDKPDSITLDVILEECLNIEKIDHKFELTLETLKIEVDSVVLALGHISPAEIHNLPQSSIGRYFRTPWQDLYTKISQKDDVLLIGSGLTSNDIILSLQERHHSGKIYSISRRGHLPLLHSKLEPYPDFHKELEGKDINEIFSIVKRHIKSHTDSRPVTDSLRPHTQRIWSGLSNTCKSRFLRHLQSRWNQVRHRMPLESNLKLKELVDENILEFLTGKISKISQVGDKIEVIWEDKLGNSNTFSCDVVVNCIGPESNYKRINSPLIKNLLLTKMIQGDVLSVKTSNFNVVDGFDILNENIFAIGPLLKGELYESTAVPEIRVQAEKLSKILLQRIKVVSSVN